MPDLARGDRVSHVSFGEGVVESVHGDTVTVRFVGQKPRTILSSYLEVLVREGSPPRPADAVCLFDAYLIVDWSANSQPKLGADSVWYCVFEPAAGRLFTANPRTRARAYDEIRTQLVELVERGLRTLVGFDFPYGFPRGTGDLLGFSGAPAWRVMWDELSVLVEDDADNHSNRFEVAADINGVMTGDAAPFWGCPPTQVGPLLQTKKPRPWPEGVVELRTTDSAAAGPKSVWQLYGAGSVGSQTLLGIPRLTGLRDDPVLKDVSLVWPFETRGIAPPVTPKGGPSVVHAEIYPSLVAPSPLEDVKDAAQVRGLAEHFSALDDAQGLAALFDLSALPVESLETVVAEEGWILGVPIPDESGDEEPADD